MPELDRVEVFDPSWTDPLELCIQKGASVTGGIGPFGIMVLASEGLDEYTSIFFRIFKDKNNKIVVFMGSDQSRSLPLLSLQKKKIKEYHSLNKLCCRSSLNDSNTKTNYGTFVDIDPCQEKLSLRILVRSLFNSKTDHFLSS